MHVVHVKFNPGLPWQKNQQEEDFMLIIPCIVNLCHDLRSQTLSQDTLSSGFLTCAIGLSSPLPVTAKAYEPSSYSSFSFTSGLLQGKDDRTSRVPGLAALACSIC
jgi:hypothetical protein